MDVIQKRFEELSQLAGRIIDSQCDKTVQIASDIQNLEGPINYYSERVPSLDGKLLVQWQTSVLSLLSRVFGMESTTTQEFRKALDHPFEQIQSQFTRLHAIFDSAKSDFEGGYLFSVRNLVHASVFTDELDQAKHFLDARYKVAAAVIAGTVLESTLREMCNQHPVLESSDKLNKMNDDLAREGVYNALRKRQISGWADIRNSAAHGRPDDFEPGDVDRMINGIRDFVAGQLS